MGKIIGPSGVIRQKVEDHEMSRVGNIQAKNPPGAGICLQVTMWIPLNASTWGSSGQCALGAPCQKKERNCAGRIRRSKTNLVFEGFRIAGNMS